MASSSTYAFFHCHYAFQKFPFFCVTLCVLHALQNATESINFFSWISSIFVGFFKSSRFFVSLCIMFTKADLPCSLYDRSLLPFVYRLTLLVGLHDSNVVSVHCRRDMLMPSHWHSGWQIHLSFFTS